MATHDLIKYAFVAGEVSPHYFGRSDLEKFDLALAQGENWFVDYRGGVSTRPGLEFIDYLKLDQRTVRLFDFKFSTDVANTNLIIMGHLYARFVQDGAYVLEASKVISAATKANPGVFTVNAHGYLNGDWIKISSAVGMIEINGQTYVIANVTANTFTLQDTFGNAINTTGFGTYTINSGRASRVYTLVTNYLDTDLAELRMHQIRDTIRLTHKRHVVRNLTRISSNSWTYTDESFTNLLATPTGLTLTSSAAGAYGIGVVVTAVNDKGEESLPTDLKIITNAINYALTEGSLTITWAPLFGARYYNVYRTRIVKNQEIVTRSQELGYIGSTFGSHFVDPNIIPDFTRTPPQENIPFANHAIDQVDVTNGGAGYTNASTLSISSSPGSGFVGYPIVSILPGGVSGPIVGVQIAKRGKNYSNPVIIASIGAGVTFSVITTPNTGNNPAVACVFQQRQIYAASDNEPLVIRGSRPGRLSNFSFSRIIAADDSYEHEIDSEVIAPIRHLIPTRGGLIIINEIGIWLLSGSNGAAVTPINAQADSQAYKGATILPPLKIDTDLLYEEGKGGSVRLLSYNDINKVYGGADMSVLSNHLFGPTKKIASWAYASVPFKIAWACREDGLGLSFTLMREQNVYAWMRQTTKGLFMGNIVIQEGTRDSVYYITKRYINGRWTQFLERMAQRDFEDVEDAWCVDAGLQLPINRGTTTIQVAAVSGNGVPVSSNTAFFTSGDIGRVLRVAGGKMNVKTFIDSTHITVDIIRPITKIVPHIDPPLPMYGSPGQWSLDTPQTVIKGLGHLEGQKVSILADGNVVAGLTVTNATVTLPQSATRVIIGLGYRCLLQTLPLSVPNAVVEDKRKRVLGMALRLREARGLKTGLELAHLYEMKERTDELWGEPTRMVDGVKYQLLEPQWDENAQTYIVQDNPLPATLLGYVVNAEVGDDDS